MPTPRDGLPEGRKPTRPAAVSLFDADAPTLCVVEASQCDEDWWRRWTGPHAVQIHLAHTTGNDLNRALQSC